MEGTARSPRFIVSHPRCLGTCGAGDDDCGFRVAWTINPHMRVGAADTRHAARQHGHFVDQLRRAGAEITKVPFVHGAFDCVFSKDNAVVVERKSGNVEALLARPRFAERQREQEARAFALEAMRVRVHDAPSAPLEGGDIVVMPGARGAFLGHGFRTGRRAADALERFLGHEVTCLELCDERLYHLDMALSVLDDGTALACREALTPRARRMLQWHPAISDVIWVPFEEALAFGVNLVQVGKTIVWGADAPRTTEALEARGYHVVRVELGEFHLAGGSAACLVSRVHRAADEVRRVQGSDDLEVAPPSVAA